jgi:TPR repeat protein
MSDMGGCWSGCGAVTECYRAGRRTTVDPVQAIGYFEKACTKASPPGIFSSAHMYRAQNKEILADDRLSLPGVKAVGSGNTICQHARRRKIGAKAYREGTTVF